LAEQESLPETVCSPQGEGRPERRGGVVTALASHRAETAGATALKIDPEQKLPPAQALDALPWAKTDTKTEARAEAAEKRAEAKAKGYEGESCGECGNFTLVRNGTCMKCDTCGSTTGCS
jgi:ribonucleoside-diphosphate reductase alpha chain